MLDRGAGDPRMPARRTPHRDFGEAGFVAVALQGRSEPVVAPILRDGCARVDDGASGHGLPQGAEIISAGVESLPVG